jgi:GDP-L-fucose synthase
MNLPEEQFQRIITDEQVPPIVNVGCGEDITVREVAELIAEVVGFRKRLVFDPSKPEGTPRKLLDISRLTAMGWKRRISLFEGVKKTYVDFLENVVHAIQPSLVRTQLP